MKKTAATARRNRAQKRAGSSKRRPEGGKFDGGFDADDRGAEHGTGVPTTFNNLPAIRFLPDGTVDENSPQTLKLMDGDGFSRWLIETPLRTGYEVSDTGPQQVAIDRAEDWAPRDFAKHCHAARRTCAAFTLAEVLAALLFLAIVIPTAVEALHVASLAGEVAARKSEAARVADRVLNESLVTTNWTGGMQSGTVTEGILDFRWKLTSQTWPQDSMAMLTAEVTYSGAGQRLFGAVEHAGQFAKPAPGHNKTAENENYEYK